MGVEPSSTSDEYQVERAVIRRATVAGASPLCSWDRTNTSTCDRRAESASIRRADGTRDVRKHRVRRPGGPGPTPARAGKVVSFDVNAPAATAVASGFSLIVDVEFGPDGVLYALSQGESPGDVPPASPARPNSGRLLRVNDDGTFTVLVDRLDLASSVDFVDDTAFVVTLNGEVWKIKHVSRLRSECDRSRRVPRCH
jgi:hypothetical protein